MKKNIVKQLVVILAFFAISSNAMAQLVWDGTSSPWTHGTGTKTDPYLIETPQNLAWLSDMVNGGVSTYLGVYFKQTEDFNMSNIQFDCIGAQNYFSGHYDGNFKSIQNLVISSLSQYVGLFGNTRGATLYGICICGIWQSGSATNKEYIGALCGRSWRDTIMDCCCNGNVVLNNQFKTINLAYIGGLVGYLNGSIIERSYVSGDVSCSKYYCNRNNVGGLVGNCDGLSIIKACYYLGTVSISGTDYRPANYTDWVYSYIGSFIGESQGNTSLNNCYCSGNRSYSSQFIESHDVIVGSVRNGSVTSGNNSVVGYSSSYATSRTSTYMASLSCPAIMNIGLDSTVFYYDSLNVNGGYPIFWYQKPVKYRVNTVCDATMGTVSGMGSYANGATATLQAEAAEGYLFTGWSDGNIENPRTVTVTSDSTYTAVFTKNAYTIHVKQDCSVSVQ